LDLQGVRRVVLKGGLCLPGNSSVVPSWKPLFFVATLGGVNLRCGASGESILEARFDGEPVRFGSRSLLAS
jgi:hypothetical protein